jgi:invasion protein IalB
MLKILKSLALLAILSAASGPLMAQDTTATEPATPPATEPAIDPATGLDMGTPVVEPAGPQLGQPYIKETYGDWALRCIKTESGDDPCQLYQLLKDTDGRAVAEVSIIPLPEGNAAKAGATFVAPLETLLPEQLTLTVDAGTPRKYSFRFCNAAGCVAQVGFSEDELNQFKRGSAATLTLVPVGAPDQKVNLNISLSGFTAGFAATATPTAAAAPAAPAPEAPQQ